jgi:pyochelin synthetase
VLEPALPLNNNSKVGRKALQAYFSNNQRQNENFTAPLNTQIEQQVANIWCELLNLTHVSRNDDFFQIGGSSITAINLISAYLAQGYSADIDLIFSNPIFSDMVAALEQSNSSKAEWLASINLYAMTEQALAQMNHASDFNPNTPVRSVLLTGASGFLGTYLLNRLLQNTDYQILCLLRCNNPQHGLDRLRQAALEKGLPDAIDTSRIRIIPGDLSQARLGLQQTEYEQLCEEVDSVIHNASIINLMDPLSALYSTNVEGVTRILEFATTRCIKPIHYISTIGVHHALPEDTTQPVIESTPVVAWRDVELTYEQSKIMAETLFGFARQKGVPVNILRPGTITWDTSSEPYINDDAFLKFYRACLNISAYPQSTLAVNIVPVDHVADSIVSISKREMGSSKNFHLVSKTSTQVTDVYRWCNELGCTIKPLPLNHWKIKLEDNFVQSFVNLYFKQGMEAGGHHQYDSNNVQQANQYYDIAPFEVSRDYLEPLTRRFNNIKA